jgi:hypothetical protein
MCAITLRPSVGTSSAPDGLAADLASVCSPFAGGRLSVYAMLSKVFCPESGSATDGLSRATHTSPVNGNVECAVANEKPAKETTLAHRDAGPVT